MNEAVFDLEADGLNPTKIHCLSVHTAKGPYTTTDYDIMRRILLGADILIGHNIIRFDIPVLERILGIKIKAKLVDTLALSWYLQPKRPRHGLESYGDDFGIEKPKIDDWEGLTSEEYQYRCSEDVRINTHLWNAQWSKLKRIYDTDEEIWKFIAYLTFKMHCAMLQEKSKWKVDLEFTKESLEKLEKLQAEKVEVLTQLMPRIPVVVKKSQPKVLTKKNGTLSKAGIDWYALLAAKNLPEETEEVEIIKGYDDPNPNSPQQVKDWLFSLGWKPITFKTNKKKKQVPQINLPNNGGLCPSILRLIEKNPDLEVIDGLGVLAHRISILNGFIKEADDNGYVKATVQGLTNTLRFQHGMPCVNLPRTNRPHAEAIRGSLMAPDGYELCGADMSSLEDRLKQHFIYPLDPDYVNSMIRPDFDPHVSLAVMAGMMSKEDGDTFRAWNIMEKEDLTDAQKTFLKHWKPTRDIAKNGNYACQYGAYPPRLAITCDITIDKAQELFDGYWKLNWAIKAVAEAQTVKTIEEKDGDEMWLKNPISGFWYSLRKDNDRFSTLIQGSASYVFDLWVGIVLKQREQLTAQFHDEIVLCVKKGTRDEMEQMLFNAINKANNILKLNRELGIGVQFDDRYSGIH